MAKLKSSDEVQAWLLALEAERHDTSWRKPFGETKTQEVAPRIVEVIKKVKLSRDDRDRIMYHAGRHAMGARDKAAVDAEQKMQKLFD